MALCAVAEIVLDGTKGGVKRGRDVREGKGKKKRPSEEKSPVYRNTRPPSMGKREKREARCRRRTIEAVKLFKKREGVTRGSSLISGGGPSLLCEGPEGRRKLTVKSVVYGYQIH